MQAFFVCHDSLAVEQLHYEAFAFEDGQPDAQAYSKHLRFGLS
jgi:hypothetical protein